MNDFDLRKYLAEGRLLKEDIKDKAISVLNNYKDKVKGVKSYIKYLRNTSDDISSSIQAIADDLDRDNYTSDSLRRDLEKLSLAEGRLLKEFIGGELEDRNEPLFSKLVPGQGKAETLEGEMLRAINRIVYRYYNDGDKYYEGYGAETAGPAVSFLVNAVHPLRAKMSRIMDGKILSDNEYENMLKEALGLILDYIEGKEGEYTKNTQGDIFDYESEYEDEDDYSDYDDDEYDYYQ